MLILVLLMCFLAPIISLSNYENYENHYCNRNCSNKDQKSIECIYNFTLEWFIVLSNDCLNCTQNAADCFRDQCISTNGHKRTVRVVNRMLPGPKIQTCLNDQITVNVYNKLNSFESTTIHWHGIKQTGTQHMDGVGMLTQCPILPNTHFQYQFKALDRGTHMWHAHSSAQRADGLFGAIIIREPNDIHSKLYDFDLSEHIIVINEWIKDISFSIYQKILQGGQILDGILINGRGTDFLNETTPRSSFKVTRGFKYRFRVLNTGSEYCPFEFSISEHILSIISTDGNPVKPVEVKSFYIMAGERVDFVLNANQLNRNYWIKVKGNADCKGVFQTAFLNYNSSNEQPNGLVNYDNSGPDVQGISLNPLIKANSDQFIGIDDLRAVSESFSQINKVDQKIHLTFGMNSSPNINNITSHLPTSPLLYQSSKTSKDTFCNDCPKNLSDLCSCIHKYDIQLNDVVELILIDVSKEQNHPIHLHGQSFAVLGMDQVLNVSIENIKNLDAEGKLKRNLINPPLKDTVQIPAGGYTIIRFKALNPGYWFFHCHVDWHSEMGMALVFKVGPDLTQRPINWPQCGDFRNEEFTSTNSFYRIKNHYILVHISFGVLILSNKF